MVIGNNCATNAENKTVKIIYKLIGTLDLHTHIMLKPMINFLMRYLNNFSIKVNILELGCGIGVNAFEAYKIAKRNNTELFYVGVDLSSKSINYAKDILRSIRDIKGKISFFQENAISFLEKNNFMQMDMILLIDIIEHVKDPQKLVFLCDKHLKNNGLLLVSVPTPLYPIYFGRNFHIKIGHLVDGYSLVQLDKLFDNIGCQRIMHRYNTGIFSNMGCWLYYNKLSITNKYFNFLKSLFLYPFRFLDFYNNDKVSCTLFAVYKKTT